MPDPAKTDTDAIDGDVLDSVVADHQAEIDQEEAEAAFEEGFNADSHDSLSDGEGGDGSAVAQLGDEIEEDEAGGGGVSEIQQHEGELNQGDAGAGATEGRSGAEGSGAPGGTAADGEATSRDAQLSEENQRLHTQVRQLQGRLGNMEARMKEIAQGVQQEATGGQAPTAAQVSQALQDDEQFKALSEEFPEWGAAMSRSIDHVATTLREEMKSVQPANLQGTIVNTVKVMMQEEALNDKHPNWKEMALDDQFVNWATANPNPDIRALYASDWPADVSTLLDKYAEAVQNAGLSNANENPNPQSDPRSRLQGNTAPTRGQTGVQHRRGVPSDEDAFAAGFEEG